MKEQIEHTTNPNTHYLIIRTDEYAGPNLNDTEIDPISLIGKFVDHQVKTYPHYSKDSERSRLLTEKGVIIDMYLILTEPVVILSNLTNEQLISLNGQINRFRITTQFYTESNEACIRTNDLISGIIIGRASQPEQKQTLIEL